jgi:Flp pilus assembly protein TadG
MTRRPLHGLRRDAAGATALEFAMTATALVLVVIGLAEGGVAYWTWQALEATATDAARCAGINAAACRNVTTTPANTQTYAALTAAARGLAGVTAGSVTVTTGAAAQAACRTTVSVVSVAVSYPFGSIPLVPLPSSLTASACFPLVAT